MKRTLDLFLSTFLLVMFSPIIVFAMLCIWLQDRKSPFYIANRVGRGGKSFKMVKLRSMVVNADKSGVDSTGSSDSRITVVGRTIRRYKLDELPQLWNVLKGEMSLVGPRPNVKRETDLYTNAERRLLSILPGITDIASIVFSDEGEILKDKEDPDLAYNQLIRPWKSTLGLVYVDNKSVRVDLLICLLTLVNSFSRKTALRIVGKLLTAMGVAREVIDVASRDKELVPAPPPGSTQIVMSRDGKV